MLIRHADVRGHGLADVRLAGGTITAIGMLTAIPGETVIEAAGGALLPGLHDHHIHLTAEAVARQSVPCGPPAVENVAQLAAALAQPGDGWLRGVGYHESVAGMLDTAAIDAMVAHRPVRIQHRSGRMWFFNSVALQLMLAATTPSPGLERVNGRWTGRLFDDDGWLRQAIAGKMPCLAGVSSDLARCGITGVTDMTVANGVDTASAFAAQQRSGGLQQRVVMAGRIDLIDAAFDPMMALGPAKLHLHEWQLPDLDETVAVIRAAHAQGRAVASHCTTEVELVFTLAALDAAGIIPGDRIEHAGMASNTLVQMVAERGLAVVSQPHFIMERGDAYRRDVPPQDNVQLYRIAAFARAGAILAAGSDAPYGNVDPWAAMRSAVSRQTRAGVILGANEALSPDAALALYLADPLDLNRERRITVGSTADLCLLDRDWASARERLLAADVRLTMINGLIVYDRVNQAPI